jgi:hypothetical protein
LASPKTVARNCAEGFLVKKLTATRTTRLKGKATTSGSRTGQLGEVARRDVFPKRA